MRSYLIRLTKTLKILCVLSAFVYTISANAAVLDIDSIESPDFSEYFSFPENDQKIQDSSLETLKGDFQEILFLVQQKNIAKAKEKVKGYIAKSPEQSLYYYLKGVLEVINGDSLRAEQSFLEAVSLNQDDFLANTALARLALEKKLYSKAEIFANKAIDNNPNAINAYKILADIAMYRQGIDAAEEVFVEARTKVKGNLSSELQISKILGEIYIANHQPKKFLVLANDLAKQYKNDTATLSLLADAQVANGEFNEAISTLNKVIQLDSKNAEAQFLLAQLLSNTNSKKSEVIDLLDKAAKAIDNPLEVLIFKTSFLVKTGDFKRAHVVAEQVSDNYPGQGLGKKLQGDIYFTEKKYEDALNSYQQAYQKRSNLVTLDAILLTLNKQNKQLQAIELLEQELKKNKANIPVEFRLAEAYLAAAKYDEAIQHYESILNNEKDNALLLNNLAWAYSQKNIPKALVFAEKAYKQAPNSGAIADTLGYLLLKDGKKEKSLDTLKKAAEMLPNEGQVQLHLAEAYIANQYYQKARGILQRLIKLDDFEKAQAKKLMSELSVHDKN